MQGAGLLAPEGRCGDRTTDGCTEKKIHRAADISPNRGITRPYDCKVYLFSSAAALCKICLQRV